MSGFDEASGEPAALREGGGISPGLLAMPGRHATPAQYSRIAEWRVAELQEASAAPQALLDHPAEQEDPMQHSPCLLRRPVCRVASTTATSSL